MTSPHTDPARYGTVFGKAIVTVDLEAGDCVITVDDPRYARRRPRFNSIEEIQGAYQVQFGLAATDQTAADVARALKFAAQQLRQHQEGRRRG